MTSGRRREQLQDWYRFVRSEAHLLQSAPQLLFQEAANQPARSAPAQAALLRFDTGRERRRWVARRNKPSEASPALLSMIGQYGIVWTCAWSPDGRRVVSGSTDGTLVLWDAVVGVLETELARLKDMHIGFCTFSPDGGRVAAVWRAPGSEDAGAVGVWDVDSGTEIVRRVTGGTSVCAFSPAGDRLALGDGEVVELWDPRPGGDSLRLTAHTGSICAVGFSPDGTRVLSVGREWVAKLWDARRGTEVASLDLLDADQRDLSRILRQAEAQIDDLLDGFGAVFDGPEDRQRHTAAMATASEVLPALVGARFGEQSESFRRVRGFRPLADRFGELARDLGLARGACAIAPDLSVIAVERNEAIELWDVARGSRYATLTGHRGSIMACALSPDGGRLASASWDRSVKIWEVESGLQLTSLDGHTDFVSACAFAPDGRTLVSAAADPPILTVWRVDGGSSGPDATSHAGYVHACAHSPDGGHIATASADNTVKLWNAETGALFKTLEGHTADVSACAWSPDGRLLASAAQDGTLRVWDVDSCAELAALAGYAPTGRAVGFEQSVTGACFSPDGRLLLSTCSDGTLKLWDAVSFIERASPPSGFRWPYCCAFSPDGEEFAVGSRANDEPSLKRFSCGSGREVGSLGGLAFVTSCGYSPGGAWLAASTLANAVKVWVIGTGTELLTLETRDPATCCAFAPTGYRILCGEAGDRLTIWSVPAGELLWEYRGAGLSASWSPDGRRIAAGARSGQVHLLELRGGNERLDRAAQ
jgi:WD40 repeat protein